MSFIEGKNYYELLGLERDATNEQIKDAYKEIARVYHPDSNFYSEIAREKAGGEQVEIFKAITAAYHTLSNKTKRVEYDKTLAPDLREWVEPVDEDAELLEKLDKLGVSPESVGMTARKEPRKRKNSSAYGIFGTFDENQGASSSLSQAQFNKTAFGHGDYGVVKKRSTLTNIMRPNIEDEPARLSNAPGAPDRTKTFLIIFAFTGSLCFLFSIIAFLVIK